jgi:hypothetical protein
MRRCMMLGCGEEWCDDPWTWMTGYIMVGLAILRGKVYASQAYEDGGA